MNAEQLLVHYKRIADATDAITKLRRFILNLAVRGKLVPQNLNDEPASELLKRIASEKSRLRLKQTVSPLGPDEIPFPLPFGWNWSRIGEVCAKTGSGSTPRGGREVYRDTGIPFLRSQNVHDDGLRLDDVAYIDHATHERMSGTRVLAGDLLLNITGGSMGRCCRVPDNFGEANISQHVAIIRTAHKGMETFLHRLILSPYFQAFVFDEQTGAGRGGLPKNRMDMIAVALPPLAEQRRIVAKVDELMALCDRLEAARTEREATRDRLTAASLARLNTPDPDSATFAKHARFALNTLPALTTRPDQIKQLRQTILNLAVRGKLVPQNPNDEPVSKLLQRIAKEKSEVPRRSNKEPADFEFAEPKQPFDVPGTWQCVRLEQIAEIGTGLTPSTSERDFYDGGDIPWINSSATYQTKILNSAHFVTRLAVQACRLKMYPPGSLIVALYGQGKTRGQVSELGLSATVNQACAVIQWLPSFGSLKSFVRLALEQQYESMRERAEGGPQPNLNVGKIKERVIALPPIEEQSRIAVKVDELMSLCDQLEASLTTSDDTRRRLLDALLAKALTSTGETSVPAVAREEVSSTVQPAYKRAVLAAEIVHRLHAQRTFGRTKHQKALQLCETFAGIEDVGGTYYRHAAGPHDKPMMMSVERILRERKWYEAAQQGSGSQVVYRALDKAGEHRAQYERYFSAEQREAVDKLLKLLAPMDTEQAEIVSTLLAAWNDFLIDGKTVTDDALVREVRENWAEEKLRIPEDRWRRALSWMRDNNLVPKGVGGRTLRKAEAARSFQR